MHKMRRALGHAHYIRGVTKLINGRVILFGDMPEPTDAEFAEQDREEAKLQRAHELREKALERAAKLRGKKKAGALADIEADADAMEAE